MKTTNSSNRSQPGFTVIELLAAVAIVGILVAIALPAYRESIARSRRADAKVALGGLAVAMERYYANQTPATYVGAAIGTIFPSEAPLDGAKKFYSLGFASTGSTNPGLTDYTLAAAPINTHVGDRCGTFTLSSTGVRGLANVPNVTTPSASLIEDCWR